MKNDRQKIIAFLSLLFLLLTALPLSGQFADTLEFQSPNEESLGNFGRSVSGAGDVNNDGHADLLAGTFREGRAYVFSGADGTLLHTLVSPNEESSGNFGFSVSGAGDVNNDGHADLLVGAYAEAGGSSPDAAGRAYVFSGADGTLLHTLVSPNESFFGWFGISVSGPGDVNNDGHADLLVGAERENSGSSPFAAGRAYVFSGADGALLYTLASPNQTSFGEFGNSVSGPGDVNNDGHADLLISATGETIGSRRSFSGAVYVFSGADGTLLHTLASPDEATTRRFGWSVSGAGDVDKDGHADLLVGDVQEGFLAPLDQEGRAYVFSGADGTLLHTLVSPNERTYGVFGVSVSGAGDVNNDSYPDLLVGALREGQGNFIVPGRAYVFSGKDGAVLHTLVSPNEATNGNFGLSVSGVGDVNNDGRADLLVGARNEAPGSSPSRAGRAYLFVSATPAGDLAALINNTIALRDDPATSPAAAAHLDDAVDCFQDALDQLNMNDVYEVFQCLEDGVEDLQLAAGDGADVTALIDAAYAVADRLAQDVYTQAQAFGGSSVADDYLSDGEAFLADALAELADGNPDQAIRRLGSAYKAFQWAIQIGSAIAQGMDAVAAINAAIANIQNLIDTGGYSSNANADLQDAIDKLNDAIDDLNDDGDIAAAYSDLQNAVEQLQDAEADGATATDEINEIVDLAKMLAEVKLAEAQEYAGNPETDDRIAMAEADLADAAAEILAGNPDRAVGDYRNAWEDARIGLEHGRGLRKTTDDGNTALPTQFALDQNYPNPFNPTTHIGFRIPQRGESDPGVPGQVSGFIELKVYDISGRLVKTLVNENRAAGSYTVQWNATNNAGQKVVSGIYFYHLKAGKQFEQVRKMMLVR